MKLFKMLLLSFVGTTSAFSHAKPTFRPLQQKATALNAFAHLTADSEEDAMYLMTKARECAFSDLCSIGEAKHFLREVVHLESGCASGTLAGHELCDNQDFTAEIVANLRAKIENGQNRGSDWQASSLSVDGAAVSTVDKFAESLVMAFSISVAVLVGTVIFSTVNIRADATPFTLQEWLWALQGGYLPRMFVHFALNGGL